VPSPDDELKTNFTVTIAGPTTITFELSITDPDAQSLTDTVDVEVLENQDPVSVIGSPDEGSVFVKGTEIYFDGNDSSDPDGRGIASYRWTSNVSGQLSSDQASFSKVLNIVGSYLITLTVTDPNGGTGTDEVSIRVRDPPAPPVARIFINRSDYNKGETIEFDGTTTTDPNPGDALNFTWRTDLGSGRTIGYGDVLRTVLPEGVHNVTLNVTDPDGLSDEETVEVTVRNRSPEAVVTGPGTVNVSQVGTFSASGSSDPDSDVLSYLWDFDDGYTGSGPAVSHFWSEWGIYNITLTVDDGSESDSISQDIFRIKVNSVPVAAIQLPDAIPVGQSFVIRANGSMDDDGDRLTYNWDFDGDMVFDSQGFTSMHTYDEEGTYEITLEVSDGFAYSTATAEVQAKYPNEAPVADAGRDIVAALIDGRGEARLDGSGSYDPDDDANANGVIDGREKDNLTYSWDLDTSKDSDQDGTADNDIDVRGKTARMVLKEEGPFNVALNVTDRRGAWAKDIVEVKGDNPPSFRSIRTTPAEKVLAGIPLTMEASVEDDDRSDDLIVTWTIDNGVVKTGTKVTHTFTSSGMKEISVAVSDGFHNETSSVQISVEKLPAPKITNPGNGTTVSGTIRIRGTAQEAGGGIIKMVEISINDGEWLKCGKSTPDWNSWYYDWDSAMGVNGENTIKVRVGIEMQSTPVYSTSQIVLIKGSSGGGSGLSMAIIIPVIVIILLAIVILFFFIRSRGKHDLEMPPNGGQMAPGPVEPPILSGPMPVMPPQQMARPGPPAPTPPQKEKTIRIKCPACGGMFAYRDTGDRPIHLVCDHCGAKGVIDAVPTEAPAQKGDGKLEGKGKPLTIICPGCSGLFEITQRVDSLVCPFCGAEGDMDEGTVKAMDELFGPIPNMVTLRCPKCSELFEIKEGDKEIACPHCGVRGKI
jgi:hypothetical protein